MQSSCAAALCPHFFRAPLQITMARTKIKKYGGSRDAENAENPENPGTAENATKKEISANTHYERLEHLSKSLVGDVNIMNAFAQSAEVRLAVLIISGLIDTCYKAYTGKDDQETESNLKSYGCNILNVNNENFKSLLLSKFDIFRGVLNIPMFPEPIDERRIDKLDDYLQLVLLHRTGLLAERSEEVPMKELEQQYRHVGEVVHAGWAANRFALLPNELPTSFNKNDTFNNEIEKANEKRKPQLMLWSELTLLGKMQDIINYYIIMFVLDYLNNVGCNVRAALDQNDKTKIDITGAITAAESIVSSIDPVPVTGGWKKKHKK